MIALVLALVAVQQPALERRVAAAPNGTVRLTFAARPGVCTSGCGDRGCGGRSVSVGRRDADEVEYDCEPGPVRLSLTVAEGRVTALRTYVGGRWRVAPPGSVTDLGTVGAREAAAYLLALAARDSGRVAERAIFPATLADSTTVWLDLLRLARDDRLTRRVRRQAVFWLGQAAGEAATRGLAELVDEAAVDRDVRESAVFALSQRPREEGVPALIRIAKENPDPELRRKAIFWLGQSEDPRALALFEELLTRP